MNLVLALVVWLLAAGCRPREVLTAPSLPLVPTPDAAFRKAPPTAEYSPAVVDVDIPIVESEQLANGLTLWVVPRADTERVAMNLVIHGAGNLGCSEDGLARTTGRLLSDGGVNWRDGSVVYPPTVSGSQVSYVPDLQSGAFFLQVGPDALHAGLDVLFRTVYLPAFGKGVPFEQILLDEALSLQRASNGAANIQFRLAAGGMWGTQLADFLIPSNPRVVTKWDIESLRRCHHAFTQPQNSVLIVVGPTTLLEVKEAVFPLTYVKGTRASRANRSMVALEPRESERIVVHMVDTSDPYQVDILLMQRAPLLYHADFAAFKVLAEVLAGDLSSRANRSLRHARGLTYGANAELFSTPDVGMMTLTLTVSRSEVRSSIDAVLAMLNELKQKPITDEELKRAQAQLVRQYARALRANVGVSRWLSHVYTEGRQPSMMLESIDAIRSVTAEQVRRVAAEYLEPEYAQFAVFGEPRVGKDLASLGEVIHYSIDLAKP